jgi:hypothetical protein
MQFLPFSYRFPLRFARGAKPNRFPLQAGGT